ncbi:MAG: hypothetical protein P9M14_11160 [Candidatus Alcyoniella australis]|nr:hypothetical protein [Candidatus Alcyoniella australis]
MRFRRTTIAIVLGLAVLGAPLLSATAAALRRPSPAEVNYGMFLINQRLERLWAIQPPPWDHLLNEYNVTFGAYPLSEEGKAALFAVARIEAGRGNLLAARRACLQIMQFYPNGTKLDNFWEGGGPIDLKHAAQLQWARLIQDDNAALQVLDDPALRLADGVVGSPYAPSPWYGPVQVERALVRAPILMRKGKGAQAVDGLLDVLEKHGREPRLADGRVLPASQALLDRLERLLEQRAVEPPRLYMVLGRIKQACDNPADAARSLLLEGRALSVRAVVDNNRSRFGQAQDLYVRTALQSGAVPIFAQDRVVPADVEAVERLAGLARLGYMPQQVMMRLERLARDARCSEQCAGHAWLEHARLTLDLLDSPGQARYGLGIVLDRYSDVPAYVESSPGLTLGEIAMRRQRKLVK